MENNQEMQDTPQQDGFQQVDPLEGSSNENVSVQDAFFGEKEEAAPQEGQPAQQETQPTEPESVSNDTKRFEYWQSQADKVRNENEALKQQVQQMHQQPIQQPQQPAPPAQEEFPPAPDRPRKPSGFNRSEAYSDPDSSSAKYLDEVEDWRSEMDEYTALRQEYNNALVQERVQSFENQKRQEDIKRQQYQARVSQLNEVNDYVQGHYGLEANEAQEFIKEMSDPKSLSMDNLVQLWRMKKGTDAVPGNATEPSSAFQQTQRAQQVPSPMGVMPSQSGNSTKSDSDSIMDGLINDFKNKNPW